MSSDLKRKIIVFDYETDSVNANDSICNPIELAAVAIDLKNRRIIPNSEFSINICPPTINDENYYQLHKDTINFHSKNTGLSPEQLMDKWKSGTLEKVAWEEFQTYIKNYGGGKAYDLTPIAGGMNIRNFDIPINNRLHAKYKTKDLFWKRTTIDLLDIFGYWFLYSNNRPSSYSMDSIRKHFNLESEGAHTALFDVMQTAEIMCKFLDIFNEVSNEKWLQLN